MEQVLNWVVENQEMLLSYTIKFIVAILILVVGKIVANSVAKLMGKGMQKREMDGAVVSFKASCTCVKWVLFRNQ